MVHTSAVALCNKEHIICFFDILDATYPSVREGSLIHSVRSTQTANKPNKLRDGERDNFVKLNINGKGGRRKFVNGIKTKRASVYGRRRTFKKYKKSQEGDEAVAEGIVDGEADIDSVHPSKLKSTKKHSSRYNAGVSSKSGPSLWIDEGWLDKSLQTEARLVWYLWRKAKRRMEVEGSCCKDPE